MGVRGAQFDQIWFGDDGESHGVRVRYSIADVTSFKLTAGSSLPQPLSC
jgi:hypothetical protein